MRIGIMMKTIKYQEIRLLSVFLGGMLLTVSAPSFGSEFVDSRGKKKKVEEAVFVSARLKYPQLFRDRTLEIMEAKATASAANKNLNQAYKIYCESYKLLEKEFILSTNERNLGVNFDVDTQDKFDRMKQKCLSKNMW